jgi:hypothetical protein
VKLEKEMKRVNASKKFIREMDEKFYQESIESIANF